MRRVPEAADHKKQCQQEENGQRAGREHNSSICVVAAGNREVDPGGRGANEPYHGQQTPPIAIQSGALRLPDRVVLVRNG
jgi:hypothetical protein